MRKRSCLRNGDDCVDNPLRITRYVLSSKIQTIKKEKRYDGLLRFIYHYLLSGAFIMPKSLVVVESSRESEDNQQIPWSRLYCAFLSGAHS